MNQNPFKSAPSAVKADPYSNKTHWRIDIVLVVITLALMFFALRLSAHDRAGASVDNSPAAAAQK